MDSIEYDICCPVDDNLKEKWLSKLKKEKNILLETINEQESALKIISNPLRLSIIQFLSYRPHCVCEIVQKLDIPHSNASYHISQLIFTDILENVNNNGRVYYSLTKYGKDLITWLEKIPKNK